MKRQQPKLLASGDTGVSCDCSIVLYDDHMMPVIVMMVILGMDHHISFVADNHRVGPHEGGKRKERGKNNRKFHCHHIRSPQQSPGIPL